MISIIVFVQLSSHLEKMLQRIIKVRSTAVSPFLSQQCHTSADILKGSWYPPHQYHQHDQEKGNVLIVRKVYFYDSSFYICCLYYNEWLDMFFHFIILLICPSRHAYIIYITIRRISTKESEGCDMWWRDGGHFSALSLGRAGMGCWYCFGWSSKVCVFPLKIF